MLAATRDFRPVPSPGRWFRRRAVEAVGLLAGMLLLAGARAVAAAPDAGAGLLIRVPNPITSEVVVEIHNKIEDAFRRQANLKVIIFDFNAEGPSATSDIYPCGKFFDNLVKLKNKVQTVAFVHADVSRHAVLPVLGCTSLIMTKNATLGDVRGTPPEPITKIIQYYYQQAAELPRFAQSPALVYKMLHKDMRIFRSRNKAAIYVDIAKVKDAERGRYEEVTGLQGGTARYSARDAKDCGLCTDIYDDLKQFVREEGLSERILRPGIPTGPKNAWLVDVSGELTQSQVNSLKRKIGQAIRHGGNLIILMLDCQGGDTVAAVDLGIYLRDLKDDKDLRPVATVAYVPPGNKLGPATAVALGCTEIIMGKDSALGDFGNLQKAPANPGDKGLDQYVMFRKALVELAEKRGYAPLLIQGTLDPNLIILLAESKAHPNRYFPVSEEEFKRDQSGADGKPKWNADVKTLKHKGVLLTLDATTAYHFHIARQVVNDLREVYQQYNLDPEKVQKPASDLLDELGTFFRSPTVRMMLVMIGIIGLILEMKMPGVGIPGVVAAVCFVLYFWAQSSIAGEFTWLAILLFALGLILIALEVFVLPGMAVFGISGVVLVVTSLVLVTLEKAPTTTRDWWELGMTLTTYTLSLVAAIVCAFLIARYLPQIPYANRLVLTPPSDNPESLDEEKSGGGTYALLGAIGEAATNLRPAGKARFGDDFLDVMAEGSYVLAGKRVQVIEIEGNRIVVKEV